MKTSKLLTLMLLMLVFTLSTFAQAPDRREKRKQIQAHKIAFITQKLELTPEEAQKFWPIYNQCEEKQKEFRKSRDRNHGKSDGERQKPNIDEMSDKEVEELINQDFEKKELGLALHKECIGKFKEVLPIKKVAKLHIAEKEFRKTLLKRMGERRGGERVPYEQK